MVETRFRTAVLIVAATLVIALATHTPVAAGGNEFARFSEILAAQALYEEVLRLGKGGPYSGPYTAPLHTDPAGPSYLWGGLDPISAIDRYDEDIATDRGKVVFISRSGSNVGKPEYYLDLPIFPGSATYERALFRSAENRDRFVEMMNDGSLIIAFGLNCQYGVIAGPASNGARHSHWAQPGLAAINVERFFGGRVTVLGVNLYSRGDDWNAIPKRWKYAIRAFRQLLRHDEQWERERIEMPIIKVNNF
jgi:hypothetical protein